jgi:hypothetical protein
MKNITLLLISTATFVLQAFSPNCSAKITDKIIRPTDSGQYKVNTSDRLAANPKSEIIHSKGSSPYPRQAQWGDVPCEGKSPVNFVTAETKSYYFSICGTDNRPTRYISYDYKVTKKPGKSLMLPLESFAFNKYTAVSGVIRYTLTSKYLTVAKRGRIILKEKITSWHSHRPNVD